MIHQPVVAAVLALSLLSRAASAQNPQPPAATPPASAPQAQKSRTLWDYQAELGLSDAQIARMKSAVGVLQDKLAEVGKTVALHNAKIKQLTDSNADVREIRAELRKVADSQIDARIADIETSRAVNKIMTADQLKKWHAIQAANHPAQK